MTAHECLEHKWLQESIETSPLQNGHTTTLAAGDIHVQPQPMVEKKTPPLPPKPSFLRRSSIKPITFESNATSSSSSPITVHNSNASDIIVDQALNATNEFHTKNDCLKSNTSTAAAILEDYTNKENINLSKILANRTPTTVSGVSHAKGISLNLNSSICSSSKSNLDYADDTSASIHSDVAIMSTTNSIPTTTSAAPPVTKYEQSLFPDAPTTPKVCRKSMLDAATPASVALVKQFQMSHKAANANDFVCSTNGDSVSDTYSLVVNGTSSSVNHITTTDAYHYRTTVTAPKAHLQQFPYPNAHHHLHHITRSTNSSATLTSTTNSVNDLLSSPSSNASIRCICDKADSSCCCSTTTLYRREKSIAVVDNSILC